MSSEDLIEITNIFPSKNEYPPRHNYKWSHNETDQLYREFELKQYSIQKIAFLHNRTCDAILYRLKLENLIDKDFIVNYQKNIDTILKNYGVGFLGLLRF